MNYSQLPPHTELQCPPAFRRFAPMRFDGLTSWEALASIAQDPLLLQESASADSFYADLDQHGVTPAGMKALSAFKFVCLVPRPKHIPPKLFHEHWLEKHSLIAKSAAPALRMKRYVQSHVIASPTIDGFGEGRDWTPNPYSGMTEVWWDSEQDMAAGFASEEGQKASLLLAEDERNVTDSTVIVWAAKEYEIFNYWRS
jgi:heme-degrading monooxygenase HmoA